MTTAYSYVRFSSARQADGDSLRRQTDRAADWCRRHEVRLDTSTTLHDLGKSAYSGAHRVNPDRNALALFLKLVEDGRIPRGSYLIVESLDRLSREHVQPALLLVLGLLQAGVRVVQLAPVEQVYDDKSEAMAVMMMIVELARGNSESRVKSERCRAAWGRKKDAARASNLPMTRNLPRWLELRGGKVVPIPARVAVVKKIFALAAAGGGLRAIAAKLKADGIDSFGGRRKEWTRSYLNLIISDRRALGTHTFNRPDATGAYRRDEADTAEGYLPAVVTEAEYHAAVTALRGRAGSTGRRSQKYVNVFAGLLKTPEGSPWHLTYWRSSGQKVFGLVPFSATEGFAKFTSIRYELLERAVLTQLLELPASEVFDAAGGASRAADLAAEVARLEADVAALEAELEGDAIPSIARALRKKESRLAEARRELVAARAAEANPATEAYAEVRSLAAVLDRSADKDAVRAKIKAALRRAVTRATMMVGVTRPYRVAVVRLEFVGGRVRQYYLGVSDRPPRLEWVASVGGTPTPAGAGYDISTPAGAKRMAEVLARGYDHVRGSLVAAMMDLTGGGSPARPAGGS